MLVVVGVSANVSDWMSQCLDVCVTDTRAPDAHGSLCPCSAYWFGMDLNLKTYKYGLEVEVHVRRGGHSQWPALPFWLAVLTKQQGLLHQFPLLLTLIHLH